MKILRSFFLGLMAEVLGYHWYPECGHVSKEGVVSERTLRRLRRMGWNGKICPRCFEGQYASCHWCREAIHPGAKVTAGVILAPVPRGAKTSQLLGKGDLMVAKLGSGVLVLVSMGNARVGCSSPLCLQKHGGRELLGVWEGSGKIIPL